MSRSRYLLLFLLIPVWGWTISFPKQRANAWKDDYSSIAGIEHYAQWGTYNVHDPAVIRVGDTYYMYSTDAVYSPRGLANPAWIKTGNIQVRSSKDLIHWRFEQWAFDSIPMEAVRWVHSNNQGKGATNIWAPYVIKYNNKFRLYYCVSAFGLQVSYIGLAESDSPLGPWQLKGEVVKTRRGDAMNAIDPSVITDFATGKMWMHYGSYFGGLYVVELNPATGLSAKANDQGKLVARRANYQRDNLEAPEIIYHPQFKKYYLFTSYDPLISTYNIRVARSDSPDGPFYDYFGQDLRDTTNNYPILTHPYQFQQHLGWAGVGHCAVFADKKNGFYMAHQGRLSPDNNKMVLHVRQLHWTADGWPVASPERFEQVSTTRFSAKNIRGHWEIIRIYDSKTVHNFTFGQIKTIGFHDRQTEINPSQTIELLSSGQIKDYDYRWSFSKKKGLTLYLDNEIIEHLQVFVGHDWENQTETLLFSGLDSFGCSVWGKKIANP